MILYYVRPKRTAYTAIARAKKKPFKGFPSPGLSQAISYGVHLLLDPTGSNFIEHGTDFSFTFSITYYDFWCIPHLSTLLALGSYS